MGDGDDLAAEINVLPELREDFSSAHTGVAGPNNDTLEVRCRSADDLLFIPHAHYRPLFPAGSFQPEPGKRICGKNSLVHCPIKDVAQALNIPVDGCLRELPLAMAVSPVLPDQALVDLPNLLLCKVW